MNDLISVYLPVGNRQYRIKILPADEEAVRKSARLIQEKIQEFQRDFTGKDMQDYISMALIWFCNQQPQQLQQQVEQQDMEAGINQLDQLLNKGLAMSGQEGS